MSVADELKAVERQVGRRSTDQCNWARTWWHAVVPLPPWLLSCTPEGLLYLLQIYDLESKYLEQSSTLGNAIRGEVTGVLFALNPSTIPLPEYAIAMLVSVSLYAS